MRVFRRHSSGIPWSANQRAISSDRANIMNGLESEGCLPPRLPRSRKSSEGAELLYSAAKCSAEFRVWMGESVLNKTPHRALPPPWIKWDTNRGGPVNSEKSSLYDLEPGARIICGDGNSMERRSPLIASVCTFRVNLGVNRHPSSFHDSVRSRSEIIRSSRSSNSHRLHQARCFNAFPGKEWREGGDSIRGNGFQENMLELVR